MITEFIQLKAKAGNGPVWINPMYIISMKVVYKRPDAESAPVPDGTCMVVDELAHRVFELPSEIKAMVILSNESKLRKLAEVTNLIS